MGVGRFDPPQRKGALEHTARLLQKDGWPEPRQIWTGRGKTRCSWDIGDVRVDAFATNHLGSPKVYAHAEWHEGSELKTAGRWPEPDAYRWSSFERMSWTLHAAIKDMVR